MEIIQAVRWGAGGVVRIIDQRELPQRYVERELPQRYVERELRTLEEVCEAIRTLAVRGAPAIGIAGAMGLVSALRTAPAASREALLTRAGEYAAAIRGTRPTAVNLPWALDRVLARGRASRGDSAAVVDAMADEATAILDEDRSMCRRIGENAQPLIPDGSRILTHCNAGALATGGIGTALAAVYRAVEMGKKVEVLADETRPLLQGSRLTAWELGRAGIPVTVLGDGMAAWAMRRGMVDLCFVGADRIAANGDVANKIGTYGVALAARHHDIPFYVAAPASTLDPGTTSGEDIHIEQRPSDELRRVAGVATAPEDVCAFNPAFDVTPGELVSAIVTDRGLHRAPYHFAP